MCLVLFECYLSVCFRACLPLCSVCACVRMIHFVMIRKKEGNEVCVYASVCVCVCVSVSVFVRVCAYLCMRVCD